MTPYELLSVDNDILMYFKNVFDLDSSFLKSPIILKMLHQ